MDNAEIIRRLKTATEEIEFVLAKLAEPKTVEVEDTPLTNRRIVWGSKVGLQFKAGVFWIEEKLGIDADELMAVMGFETGYTFDPAVKNMAGSSGTGLIQFMRATAIGLGTTVEALAQMTAVRQLGFVYHYFRQFGTDFSQRSLEDIYMYVLYPRAVGKPLDWEMPWKYGSLAYKQNAGLDLNKDRKITKFEASAGVRKSMELGRQFMG